MRILAEVNKGNSPDDVLDRLLRVTEEIGQTGVTEKEVDRAKTQLLKQWEMAAARIRAVLPVELSNVGPRKADWRLYFLYRDRIEKVTPEDVKRVAATYLQRNNRTVGVYIPSETSERIGIPATPDVAKMVRDYQGRENTAVGESFDASPANIESRTQRITLPTGFRKSPCCPKRHTAKWCNCVWQCGTATRRILPD